MVPIVSHSVAEEVLPDLSPGKGFFCLVSVVSKILIREVEQKSQGGKSVYTLVNFSKVPLSPSKGQWFQL